jgi:hypothetical protein
MTDGKQYYVCIGDGCHHHSGKKSPIVFENRRQEATNFTSRTRGPALHTENGSPARSVFRP